MAPSRRGRVLGRRAQDLGWFLLTPLFTFTVMLWSLQLVNDLHDGPLHGASLDLSGKLGLVGATVITIIVVDFFLWLSHFLRHKIPPLWRFHQVHAQTQISPLTDKRFHFIEPLMFVAIAIVPVALLGLNIGGTQLSTLALIYATGFTHAQPPVERRTARVAVRHPAVAPHSPLHRGAALGEELRCRT